MSPAESMAQYRERAAQIRAENEQRRAIREAARFADDGPDIPAEEAPPAPAASGPGPSRHRRSATS